MRRLVSLGRLLMTAGGCVVGTWLAVAVGYLLCVLFAATYRCARSGAEQVGAADEAPLRFVMLVPAHNEEAGISATLSSLARIEYAEHCVRTIVIADNCTDGTSAIVRARGVEVWDRECPEARGKGHGLKWALDRLLAEPTAQFDAVVMVDADCEVSANLLSEMARGLRQSSAVQARYVINNSDQSAAAALRAAAFLLMDTVRPLGKDALGLSCGLFGTGMGFRRELLQRHRWNVASLAEDAEYHSTLVLAGERVRFAPEAWVASSMPVSLTAGAEQQARWEGGKVDLLRRWTVPLLGRFVRRGDLGALHAGLEQMVPPQSLLTLGGAATGLIALTVRSKYVAALAVLTLMGQAIFTLGGLLLVRAPTHIFRALGLAPVLIVRKAILYRHLVAGRGPTAWVRTKRGDG